MVHNGIEYGDMQLICEAYQLMKDALGMNHDEMSEVRLDSQNTQKIFFIKFLFVLGIQKMERNRIGIVFNRNNDKYFKI